MTRLVFWLAVFGFLLFGKELDAIVILLMGVIYSLEQLGEQFCEHARDMRRHHEFERDAFDFAKRAQANRR